MTPKEFLSNIRKKDLEILALEDAVLAQHTKLTRISPVLSDMPSGGAQEDKMASGIVKLIELKEKLNKEIDRICEEKKVAMDMVKEIEDPLHRQILYERYFNYKCFEEIAMITSYSYYEIIRKHGHALQAFQIVKDRKTTQLLT